MSLTLQHINAIITGKCCDPFSILGMHQTTSGIEIRVFIPNAVHIVLIEKISQKEIADFYQIDKAGFFIVKLPDCSQNFAYQLLVNWGDRCELKDDPYSYWFWLQETDIWLLKEGRLLYAYNKLGAHIVKIGDTQGVVFAVWAPNAKRVSVVGEFNQWDGRQHPMRLRKETGIWELFLPQAKNEQLYKYELIDCKDHVILKADPYAFSMEIRPNTASKIIASPKRHQSNTPHKQGNQLDKPVVIYEVHLGSWKRHDDNSSLTYRELANTLIPYVKKMGFTHIELLPIMEHPFDGSWGYQPIGLFAPTSRFGTPDDFAYFIQCAHQNSINIILDWVPGHFPEDDYGLRQFDGSPLYEYANPKEGFHTDWNTLVYNYSRYEVRNFLISNALYWLDTYGIDGFRFDAVASMIYRDYSRKEGEWIPNQYGGKENLEAISFLKEVNQDISRYFPSAISIAEESTDYPCVTLPPENGGLGFHYKWNMGWMHDMFTYLKLDPLFRKYHHHLITFGMFYAYSENYVLPLSHDEMVHGKGSLLNKMAGDEWQKFANLRAFYGFMWAFPGKKLLFMGSEFAQKNEWDHDAQLDWYLLDQKELNLHTGIQQLIRDLNHQYCKHAALYQLDFKVEGFRWLVVDDCNNSVFVFERIDSDGNAIIIVTNFTPVIHCDYRFGISQAGLYRELINTDSSYYGGDNVGNYGEIQSEPIASHGQNDSLSLTLPSLATIYLIKSEVSNGELV